jgi:hypothetical protein
MKDFSGLPKEEAERIQRHVYSKEHAAVIDPLNPPSLAKSAADQAERHGTARQATGKNREPKKPGVRKDKRPTEYEDFVNKQADISTESSKQRSVKVKKTRAERAAEYDKLAGKLEDLNKHQFLPAPAEAPPKIYGSTFPTGTGKVKGRIKSKPRTGPDHTPASWKKPKKELSRLVNLIMLESTQVRNNNGTFGSGDQPMTDPRTMQYAYHRPNPQGGFDHNMNGQKRGRGRPPGSLNRRTLASREVQEAAIAQQPEVRQQQQGLGLGTKALIGAGILGGAALVAGPKLAPAFKASRRAAMAAERIGGRIGEPVTKAGTAAGWSTAIFGEKMSLKAAKEGVPIEEAIANRAQSIADLRAARIKGRKPAPAPDPVTGITPWPEPKQNKVQRQTAAERQADKNKIESLNQQVKNKALQAAHAQTQTDLDKYKKQVGDLEKRVKVLTGEAETAATTQAATQAQLKQAVIPPTEPERLQAARKKIGEIRNPEAGAVTPEQAEAWEGAKVARPTGKQPKQGELFVTARTEVPLGISDYDKLHNDLLQNVKASQGNEIARISAATGHDPEDVAKAMVTRRMQGEMTRYAPAPDHPGPYALTRDKEKYKKDVAELTGPTSSLTEVDREAVARISKKGDDAEKEAKAIFHANMKAQGISDESKYTAAHKATLAKDAKAAREKAERAEATQLVSEKKLPKRLLTDVAPGFKVSAREHAKWDYTHGHFARRILQRIELQRISSISMKLIPGMIELSMPLPLFPNEEKARRNWGEVGKDAAIGGVASAVGTAGLLYGAAKAFGKKAPDLSKMLKTASGQHLRVFNPMTTVPMMRSLPEASRIFGKQLRAVSSAEAMAASGKQPTIEKISEAFKKSGLGPQDPKDIAAFHKKWGRTPGETMEKSVGLLSGMAATGVGAGVGAALSPGLKKKRREELSALYPAMIELGIGGEPVLSRDVFSGIEQFLANRRSRLGKLNLTPRKKPRPWWVTKDPRLTSPVQT